MAIFHLGQFETFVNKDGSSRIIGINSEQSRNLLTEGLDTRNVFADLEAKCAERAKKYVGGKIKRVAGTRFYTMRPPTRIEAKERRELEIQAQKEKLFLENWHFDTDVTHINMCSEVISTEIDSSRSLETPKHKSVRKVVDSKPLVMISKAPVDNLLRAVGNICRRNGLEITIIGKRAVTSRYTRYHGRIYLRAKTKHENGVRAKCDLRTDTWTATIMSRLLERTSGVGVIETDHFGPGSSGIVLQDTDLRGSRGTSRRGLFVVRGRYGNKLYDAQSTVTTETAVMMVHYSATERFWKRYSVTLQEGSGATHQCTSDFDAEECGEVAALMTQALYPCGKLTCRTCKDEFMGMSLQEYSTTHKEALMRVITQLRLKGEDYAHVVRILTCYEKFMSARNEKLDVFVENKSLIGTRTEMPFKNLSYLNEVVFKGGLASKEELEKSSVMINELIRFQRNRTDNVMKGSLDHFRNKVSGKVQINLDLMCDNQLDEDGNFDWKQRAYHAKRLLGNFFEPVDATNGYEKHVVRIFPNGSRKTAIGKLIISTNLETFRMQMQGEPVGEMPLTTECTSKIKGSFVYPCCCVTDDNGNPIKSTMRIPTKNHLVVGNAGDSKYVVMPRVAEDQMYIAKQGYCHVNIFLAMLINVSQAQAKDYTKMVRDIVMPKLGQWPTMLDVATLCYMLAVFFPDTQSAELPRILVDHKTKTMHVIDSFGSYSTGYHTLKANTVGQLINFVNSDLESEMVHYRVGGITPKYSKESSEDSAVMLLARGVYRPKELKIILERDPMILLYGLISPSVLVAMYTSKTLDQAIHHFLHKDLTVAQICTTLKTLAQKVQTSDILIRQHELIHEGLWNLAHLTDSYKGGSPSKGYVQCIILRLIDDWNANKSISEAGFVPMHVLGDELREKKFKQDLDNSWRDLRLSEKFAAIMQSRKVYEDFTAGGDRTEHGTRETWISSAKSCFSAKAQRVRKAITCLKARMITKGYETTGKLVCRMVLATKLCCPDLTRMVNVLSVTFLLFKLFVSVKEHLAVHNRLRIIQDQASKDAMHGKIVFAYDMLEFKNKKRLTEMEFIQHLKSTDQDLWRFYMSYYGPQENVAEQSKGKGEMQLEKIVAFTALIMMIYDAERSDCVYKILNKLKGIMGTIGTEPVVFQSIDDVQNIMEEKKLTIDLEVASESHQINGLSGPTFATWWQSQLENGRAIAHYRTEGHFMEFTRANAIIVANDIAHNEHNDIMVMGAVGSGKSTGLPYHLSKKGKVLIIEPTKPLAENVHKQLSGHPFRVNTTLKMRGHCVFGSSPITVMTSGYALHYYAHNVERLNEYQFVMFDECHVHDASAMAFRCLLHEYSYTGKVLKVSATPPGHKPEYITQFKVRAKIEESLSFHQFVQAQGTGSNADVVQDGDNILVYVASYNEVDNLSKLLADKGFKVTKVDGRTMKVGNVEIPTTGTKEKKHFVVATNIIENGVTLDIDVVVDFGMKVVPELDMDSRMIRYGKVSISYGERIQRLGRVGRNKEGTFLRIGHTEVGLTAVPTVVSTEAAFYCFAYGLPVIASGVVVSALSSCTVPQARTMMNFELPVFYTKYLVRFDGSMHPELHRVLTKYKLRDSEIVLNKMAIPNQSLGEWKSVDEYARIGARISAVDGTRLPFHTKDVPDKVHENIWQIVCAHKSDAGFGRVSSASACKIAYTLQTDVSSIQRTVCILEALIANELKKQEYFRSATSSNCSSSFSLVSITNAIRARHMSDHTGENIAVLQAARNQILEFKNLNISNPTETHLKDFGAMECVQFQSGEEISKHLKLRGHWNTSIVTKDIIVAGATLLGGLWMLCSYFAETIREPVVYEGSGKRSRQKLRFDKTRTLKHSYEVRADESAEHYFGEAYGKKPTKSGKTHGMGTKTRRFYNMYGFDPTEYTFARYVDPLTGYTLDESVLTDVALVQDHFGKIRADLLDNDKISRQHVINSPKLDVYFVKDLAKQVIKIDMTPHNPLLVTRSNDIAGFPERRDELRQTGQHTLIDASQLPKRNEFEETDFEGKATFQGLRDYNPISTTICLLTNDSDGHTSEMHGIGYGPFIITNQHLFRRNNGSLTIQTHRGKYVVQNTTQLLIFPFGMRDMLLIKMPKDFPPFPMRLRFRAPISGERVCMVGSNFQEKHISSTVSETSLIAQKDDSYFYRHWVTTKAGQCGLPFVSVKDGYVLGIHSMTSLANASSFFVAFPEDMVEKYLHSHDSLNWQKHWKLNADNSSWGSLKIVSEKPDNLFKLSKDILGLFDETVSYQSTEEGWLHARLHGNLKAVAKTQGQLVTKHVVKGKCLLFAAYLEVFPDEKTYFEPLMGAYQKSLLNKEAYIKDLFKYASDIVVGNLNTSNFEKAEVQVENLLRSLGFQTCDYVTDTNAIFGALNMKAAVGALYQGKKKEYFADFTEADKETILRDSCKRLYLGKMGVWNGSLKAELRAREKVEANKTRSFTAAPLDTLLGGKVCVDDFNNEFYSLNLKGPWSVGMTKFYGGWDDLLGQLPDGWIYCDADGSQFDSSLTPYLLNAVLELRLKFMEEWDIGTVMLQNLYTEIVYTPIATPDGTIVKKFKGNNSGQPSTVVDNTLMVILAMHYAGNCNSTLEELSAYCKFFVNGDDLLLAVRPDMESFLDTLSEHFGHLGLKYDFSSRHNDKKNLWFMSHRGIQYEDMLIPKLEQERIVSILEWDRAHLPEHRLEAICASMIEAWGYPDLLHRIRKFYHWVLEQAPYNMLAQEGKAPYISEVALKTLYTSKEPTCEELRQYMDRIVLDLQTGEEQVVFQADEKDDETLNAGKTSSSKPKQNQEQQTEKLNTQSDGQKLSNVNDRDVDAGSRGTFSVPKLKAMKGTMALPKVGGKAIVNLEHLLMYEPNQQDLSNTRATHAQFQSWYESLMKAYELDSNSMGIVMNGLMVWCIENGTSPNINGSWTMMDGDEQVEFPLKPVLENAQPTLRQIMAHFSDLAEAYIEKRNATKPYMPRYGMQRNLRDFSLARYAFDFFEMTSKTPIRAREAHLQMKAAALRDGQTRMFGLDGNAGNQEENTERHTTSDASTNLHHLTGVRF